MERHCIPETVLRALQELVQPTSQHHHLVDMRIDPYIKEEFNEQETKKQLPKGLGKQHSIQEQQSDLKGLWF